MSYGVAVIIGTEFSELERLAKTMHVWAPETSDNLELVERLNNELSGSTRQESGITLYFYDPGEPPEETFLSLLDTVDLHHGPFTNDPPWNFMEVHGLTLTPSVAEALKQLHVCQFHDTSDGFVASR